MARLQVQSTITGESKEFLCDADQSMLDVLRDELGCHNPSMEVDISALTQVMALFKKGCLVMDEVCCRRAPRRRLARLACLFP